MSTAICFAGQGAQKPGMFMEIYNENSEVRQLFNQASNILNMDMEKLCFDSSSDELKITKNTQPSVLLCDIAAWIILKDKIETPAYMAGFSLGEYAALFAAGCISFEDTFRIIKVRAAGMQNAVPVGKGGMMALIGIDDLKKINEVITAEGTEHVWIANINTVGQVVLSGYKSELEKLAVRFENLCRTQMLPVSAPFHCPLMQPAKESLEKLLQSIKFNNTKIPIICNYNGKPEWEGNELKRKVLLQTYNSVHWKESIQYMRGNGVNKFIECGPGKTLSGFVMRFRYEGVQIENVHNIKSYNKAIGN